MGKKKRKVALTNDLGSNLKPDLETDLSFEAVLEMFLTTPAPKQDEQTTPDIECEEPLNEQEKDSEK